MRKSMLHIALTLLSYLLPTKVAYATGRCLSFVVDGLCWVVNAVASVPAKLADESWRVVERMFTQKTAHQLNIFSRQAKSTGALCAPLLS